MRRSVIEARSFIRIVLAMGAVPAVLAACNNPPAPTDANHTGLDGGTVEDTGPVAITLPPASAGTAGAAAMLACAGTSTRPSGGALIPVDMTLVSFGENGDKAPNTRLCFCPDNVLSAEALTGTTCGASCQDVMSDATGHVSVMAQTGGWYAYRVFGHDGPTARTTFLDSIQVNEPAPAASGGSVDGNAISQLIANTISEAQLITRQPGTTTVAGRIFDCAGDDVSNAIIRAFHADGTEIVEGTETAQSHFRYFDGNETPDASAMYTNTDGLYVILNVTPSADAERIRVEAWANTGAAEGAAHRIGCEAVQLFTDGVSIVNIGPERNDYEAGNPCGS